MARNLGDMLSYGPAMPRTRMSNEPLERKVDPATLASILMAARKSRPVNPEEVDPRELELRARREWAEGNPMPEQPLTEEQNSELAYRKQALEPNWTRDSTAGAIADGTLPDDVSMSAVKNAQKYPDLKGMSPLMSVKQLDEAVSQGKITDDEYIEQLRGILGR